MGLSPKVKTLIAMWSLEAPYCAKASQVWSFPTTDTKTTKTGTTVGVGVVVDRRFDADGGNRILVAKFRESGHVTLAPSLQMEYGAA